MTFSNPSSVLDIRLYVSRTPSRCRCTQDPRLGSWTSIFNIPEMSPASLIKSLLPSLLLSHNILAISGFQSPTEDSSNNILELNKQLQHEENSILRRQLSNPGYAVCFANSAICSLSLLVRCSSGKDYDTYLKCYCETGKLAIQIA